MDLTAPAETIIDIPGCSTETCIMYGGFLNLIGMRKGPDGPCSLHPEHLIGVGRGCPRCQEIKRYRSRFYNPHVFKQIPCRLYEVGEGWHPILARLHEQVVTLVPDYTVFQVKEKFGGLRVGLSLDPDLDKNLPSEVTSKVWDLCEAAEEESLRTCEYCGKAGKALGAGWIKTLCPRCAGR